MSASYTQLSFLLLLILGVLLMAISSISALKRRKKLNNLGLITEDSKKQRHNLLHKYSLAVTGLVAASKDEIEAKLWAAGIYNTRWSYLFLPLKYTLLALGVVASVALFLHGSIEPRKVILGGLFWIIAVIILPDMYLSARANKIRTQISNQLPYLLDLMAVCVQTGMTIESTMGYLSGEIAGFDKNLAYLLKKTNDRARIVGLGTALDELYERVPTPEVRSFVMTINQSLQYGSSIYQVLTTLATDIREAQMLGLEEKVGKLSAKMSVPLVLFIMFPIVILIIAPSVVRLM